MKEVKKIRKQKSFKTPNKILISFVLLSLTILFSVSTVFADPGVIYVNNQTGNDTWMGKVTLGTVPAGRNSVFEAQQKLSPVVGQLTLQTESTMEQTTME